MQPWRRVFHAGTGLTIAFAPPLFGLGTREAVVILTLCFAALAGFDLARLRVPAINALFFRIFPSLASPRERAKPASSTWFCLGALLVYAFFRLDVARASLVVLALADPAASTIGRLWGRRPLGKGTFLGTGVFAAVAWAVLAAFFGPAVAIVPAVLVAAAEVLPIGIDDNVIVPLSTAVALSLLI